MSAEASRRAGNEVDAQSWFHAQGVNVGGVADPGQPYDSDPQHGCARTTVLACGKRQRILGFQPQVLLPRQDAENGSTGEVFQGFQRRIQQRRIPPKLVDHKPGNECLVSGIE